MAYKALSNICAEIREKWAAVFGIAIYHRLGMVPVKEASVIIAVSSPHRQESLDAVSYAIEALKKQVPIWKKEKYTDEGAKWKANAECDWGKTKNGEEEEEKKVEVEGALSG